METGFCSHCKVSVERTFAWSPIDPRAEHEASPLGQERCVAASTSGAAETLAPTRALAPAVSSSACPQVLLSPDEGFLLLSSPSPC